MLTFEFSKENEAICIHGDPSGLELLVKTIDRLIKNTDEDGFDHTHLMTKEWGGIELSSIANDSHADLIHHVKVYCWKGAAPKA